MKACWTVLAVAAVAVLAYMISPAFTGMMTFYGEQNSNGKTADGTGLKFGGPVRLESQSSNQNGTSGTGSGQENQTKTNNSASGGLGPSGGLGGGGGGGGGSAPAPAPCDTTKVYGNWSVCSNGTQQRNWSDGCGSSGTDYQNCSSGNGATDIFVWPQNISVLNGSIFSLNISINTTSEVYAAALSVAYDSSLLKLTDLQAGTFLTSDGIGTFNVTNASLPGLVSLASTRLGASSGVSGFGDLLRLDFTAESAGSSAIALDDTRLISSSLADIENISHRDGLVEIFYA